MAKRGEGDGFVLLFFTTRQKRMKMNVSMMHHKDQMGISYCLPIRKTTWLVSNFS